MGLFGKKTSKAKVKKPQRIFAIGDVHGCALELEALLLKLQLEKEDLVVFLGDYIDRGADSRRVIDIVIDLESRCDVVALKGNHEAMFLDFLNRPESPGAGLFVLNGGTATLAKYANSDGSIELPEAHLNFFQNLKLYHETDEYFFVHAGVPNQPLSTLNATDHETHMLWSRYPFLGSEYQWEKLVVHGHTPVEEADIKPNRINLDTGCVYDGKLTALELPARVLHQVEKGIKNEPTLFPKEFESARLSMRFSGRLPVQARLRATEDNGMEAGADRFYETLNYNQFGLLMRELDSAAKEQSLKMNDPIEGRIGAVGSGDGAVEFVGAVVRVESRGTNVVYGIRIDSISMGMKDPSHIQSWSIRPLVKKSDSDRG